MAYGRGRELITGIELSSMAGYESSVSSSFSTLLALQKSFKDPHTSLVFTALNLYKRPFWAISIARPASYDSMK